MNANSEIRIETFGHTAEMSAQDISDILLGVTDALRYLSSEIDKDMNDDEWIINYLSMQSPLLACVIYKSDNKIGCETRKDFFQGLECIQSGKELPIFFNKKILQSIKKVCNVGQKINGQIKISSGEYCCVISTKEFAANLESILKKLERTFHYEWTTLIGQLQDVDSKDKKSDHEPCLYLYSKLYNNTIICYFNGKMFEEIRDNLQFNPIDVSIFGKVKFDKYNQPVEIVEITQYKILKPKVKFSEIKPHGILDLTGSVDSVDYIQQVRQGHE